MPVEAMLNLASSVEAEQLVDTAASNLPTTADASINHEAKSMGSQLGPAAVVVQVESILNLASSVETEALVDTAESTLPITAGASISRKSRGGQVGPAAVVVQVESSAEAEQLVGTTESTLPTTADAVISHEVEAVSEGLAHDEAEEEFSPLGPLILAPLHKMWHLFAAAPTLVPAHKEEEENAAAPTFVLAHEEEEEEAAAAPTIVLAHEEEEEVVFSPPAPVKEAMDKWKGALAQVQMSFSFPSFPSLMHASTSEAADHVLDAPPPFSRLGTQGMYASTSKAAGHVLDAPPPFSRLGTQGMYASTSKAAGHVLDAPPPFSRLGTQGMYASTSKAAGHVLDAPPPFSRLGTQGMYASTSKAAGHVLDAPPPFSRLGTQEEHDMSEATIASKEREGEDAEQDYPMPEINLKSLWNFLKI
eukprot:gene13552-19423_t